MNICSVKLFTGDTKGFTELEGVEVVPGLIHHHHDIIRGLVVDQQLAVAVLDDASRGVGNLLQKSVGVGVLLVVVAHQLKGKQTDDIDDDNEGCHASYQPPVLQSVILHVCLLTFSETLECENENNGEDGTACHTLQPVEPVEETERLKGKEYDAEQQGEDAGEMGKLTHAHRFCGYLEVVVGITRQKQFQQHGLQGAYQRHGC